MKNIFSIILVFSSIFVSSQNNKLWQGYFSYNSITDVSQNTLQVYASAENAYFKGNLSTNESQKVSTIDGLTGQNITQIYHSTAFNKTIIGHTDGLLIIVNDTDGTILNVVDIVNKPSVPPNMKRINHMMEHNGKLYISTDYGISVFDLNNMVFGDSYYIGSGGSNVAILQTTINNGFIYAVANGYGLLKGSISNPNLIDYNQWLMVSNGSWLSVEASTNTLIGITLSGAMYRFINDNPTLITTFSQIPKDTRFNNGNFVVTTQNHVYRYNDLLQETAHINTIQDFSGTFTCATYIGTTTYIGTQNNGLISLSDTNSSLSENITPNGPDQNKIFAIQTYAKGLWVVYGNYSSSYNPYPLDLYSISNYQTSNSSWKSIPYSNLLGAKSIVRIAINPKNEKTTYFASSYSGLLKLEDEIPTTIYNTSNSSLNSIIGQVPDDIRVNGFAFDKDANLWLNNSLVNNALHVLRNNGQWQSYGLPCSMNTLSDSYGRLIIDKNGTKWICSNKDGLIGFNEKYSNKCITIRDGSDQGNLPSIDVRAVAVDNKNKLWIGTKSGLRVLPNVDAFLTQNTLNTNSIIILEDNLAQELLYQQFITDIVVDGANNKWIGTAGAGVFYISADGQKTFNVFTKENSPLPSNVINDLDINPQTGEVFMATEAGMVSFKGNSTAGSEDFENVVTYPNPVRPEYNGAVFITGLMNNANIKIADIEGNLVFEETSKGGTVLWDTKAFGRHKVASGVYMIFLSSEDGTITKTKKVMIVR